MKIFEGKNKNNELIYFEISNSFLSRNSLIKKIQKIEDIHNVIKIVNQDIFCKFEFKNKIFEVIEPFGDNSRFHISETITQPSKAIEVLHLNFLENS